MNLAILSGRLGKDPKRINDDKGVTFSIATTEFINKKEYVTWHNVSCWAGTADFAEKHLCKGCRAEITGRIENREWKDKSGNKRSSSSINAQRIEPIDWKNDFNAKKAEAQGPRPEGGGDPESEDDVPF